MLCFTSFFNSVFIKCFFFFLNSVLLNERMNNWILDVQIKATSNVN
jgi:hypothetical protein